MYHVGGEYTAQSITAQLPVDKADVLPHLSVVDRNMPYLGCRPEFSVFRKGLQR
jgi:hypothetical protein